MRKGDDLIAFIVPKVEKIRGLNLPDPHGLAQACSGTDLLFTLLVLHLKNKTKNKHFFPEFVKHIVSDKHYNNESYYVEKKCRSFSSQKFKQLTSDNFSFEGRRPLGRARRRWEDNIKMDLRVVGWGAWIGSIWLRIGIGGWLL